MSVRLAGLHVYHAAQRKIGERRPIARRILVGMDLAGKTVKCRSLDETGARGGRRTLSWDKEEWNEGKFGVRGW